jgi:pilus assembly protein CpaB
VSTSIATPRRALAIALFAALAAAGLLWCYLDQFERTASGGRRVGVLRIAEGMKRGENVTDGKLAGVEVPEAYLDPRCVLAADRAKVVGLRTAELLRPGQTLMWTDLAVDEAEARDVSALVPAGLRAMTVRVNSEGTAAPAVRPGDSVDVIANLPGADPSSRSAVVLLQRIRC